MILDQISFLVYNFGEAVHNAGNAGLGGGILGGFVGAYHNIMDMGVKGKIIENAQQNGGQGLGNNTNTEGEDIVKERMKRLF